eukprot:12072550-Alexandrium_andersonii.AAC.1
MPNAHIVAARISDRPIAHQTKARKTISMHGQHEEGEDHRPLPAHALGQGADCDGRARTARH